MGCLEFLLGAFAGLAALGSLGCSDDRAGPPVGRVSAVVGAVQYRPDGGAWSDAVVNEPAAGGTALRTADAARAELRIAGNRIALGPGGELRIVRLDRDALQIAVPQGRVGLHLERNPGTATVEIDLPQGGVWLAAPGDYEIAAGAHGAAQVAVLAGSARLGGGLTDASFAFATDDAFHAWWLGQDPGDSAAAAKHLAADAITGAELLAANGTWESDGTYGAVWYPKDLAEDWAPYRYGSWRFVPPWGWTWIDAAQWGFAPSHYGRWAHIDARWGWVPGTLGDYNPAAVAFLGTAGVGLSRPGDGGAAVAWFALAPGEVPNDPDARYRNRLFASIVPRTVFAGGKPVQPALIQLPDQRLADAPIILGALRIAAASASAKAARAAPAPPAKAAAAAPVLPHEVFRVRMHQAQAQAAVAPHKKHGAAHLRQASAAAPKPRAAPSTVRLHSAHNRQHLAAGRGGARD